MHASGAALFTKPSMTFMASRDACKYFLLPLDSATDLPFPHQMLARYDENGGFDFGNHLEAKPIILFDF